jgi:hypothetical protein
MALITSFEPRPDKTIRFRSEVTCGYTVGTAHGRRVIHLETYGSDDRDIPGKVSQSIELDTRAAQELIGILSDAFPELAA